MVRSEGLPAVSFPSGEDGEALRNTDGFADEKQPSNARGGARDNFLSAAVLGNMVSLGSDAGNAGMMAVRHARLIQQLILASGNEASKAYEKWQRRGKTTVVFGSRTNNDDLPQNDIRKAGNKLRQRRRGNLLARLETTEVMQAETSRLRRATSTLEFDEDPQSGQEASEESTPKSDESKADGSSDTTTSSSSSDDSEDEVPGLGFMRVAGRRASFQASEQMPMLAQRRTGLRAPSVVSKPLDFQSPGEVRKQRQSQVGGHWGQLAGLARLMRPPSHEGGNRASILLPEGSGTLTSPRRLSGEGREGSGDAVRNEAADGVGGAVESGVDRRRLPEVFGSSRFNRYGRTTILHEQWQEPVATLKRLHLVAAERLGLDAEAGDWDPGLTYRMNLSKFEELAELKFTRRQHRAAVWIQARWRSQKIRKPMRQVIVRRLVARQRIRDWIRRVIRRKRVADAIQHLRKCIRSAIKIQAHVRRWLLAKEMRATIAFHQVQYRMTALQEQLYPSEERQRDREALERSLMSEEEVLSQQVERAMRKREADRQRAAELLQPAIRRWLGRVKAWRLLQEREKELREEQSRRRRRYRSVEDDESEHRPLSRSNFTSGPRSTLDGKKGGSDADFAKSGSQLGVEGHPSASFWHGPSGRALLALEAMTSTVEESNGGRSRANSQVRGYRARAFRKSSMALPAPAPPGFRSDMAGARGGPKRGTPRLVSVPAPMTRRARSSSDE